MPVCGFCKQEVGLGCTQLLPAEPAPPCALLHLSLCCMGLLLLPFGPGRGGGGCGKCQREGEEVVYRWDTEHDLKLPRRTHQQSITEDEQSPVIAAEHKQCCLSLKYLLKVGRTDTVISLEEKKMP